MVIHPVSDMLTRIRNAQKAGQAAVVLPFSKFKFELAKILKQEGYIGEVAKRGKKKKTLEIVLKYQDKAPKISEIQPVSKPSARVYLSKDNLRPVRQGYGVLIISTSKGLMTNRQARKEGLGGEAICRVW